ncbi:MAG TPA: DUF721 domain-containing protein [Pyrinomonadaceae bacterium]
MNEIFEALPALLREYSDSDEIRRAVAFAAWRRIAGEQLAEHASPLALEGERLIVAVSDRSWQRNLESLAGEMVFRLNSKAGTKVVGFIEFRIDQSALKSGRNSSNGGSRELEAMDEITEPLRRAADGIADDAMRRAFLFAAGSCLAREKRLADAQ